MNKKSSIDSEGKILIPKEFRDLLNITEKTKLTVMLEDNNRIIIEPYKACCKFCGRSRILVDREYPICTKCLIKLSGKINDRGHSFILD